MALQKRFLAALEMTKLRPKCKRLLPLLKKPAQGLLRIELEAIEYALTLH